MDEDELQSIVRDAYRIRLRPAMTRYVFEKLQNGGGHGEPVAVIGADARTGRAVRIELPLAELANLSTPLKSELS